MFEALALTLAREMPVAVCARILGCSQNSLWRLIDSYTEQVRAQESHVEVRELAVDETACRRGHEYVALVHDLGERKLLIGTRGTSRPSTAWCRNPKSGHGATEPPGTLSPCATLSLASSNICLQTPISLQCSMPVDEYPFHTKRERVKIWLLSNPSD